MLIDLFQYSDHMKTKFSIVGVLLFSFVLAVYTIIVKPISRLPEIDRIRIAEAFRIGQ